MWLFTFDLVLLFESLFFNGFIVCALDVVYNGIGGCLSLRVCCLGCLVCLHVL